MGQINKFDNIEKRLKLHDLLSNLMNVLLFFYSKRVEVILSILILGECAKVKIEHLNLLIDIAPSGIPRKKAGNDCYCICFYYHSIILKMYHKLVPPYFYGSCNNSNQ